MKPTSKDKQLLNMLYKFDCQLHGHIDENKFAKLDTATKDDLEANLIFFEEHFGDYPPDLILAVQKVARDEVLGPKWPSLVGQQDVEKGEQNINQHDPALVEVYKQMVELTKQTKKLTEALEAVKLWPSLSAGDD